MSRPIAQIEHELNEARLAYGPSGSTRAATERCERLYAELQEAKREWTMKRVGKPTD